jgi:xanthine dehydrogenase YagS FAD-binding subunit
MRAFDFARPRDPERVRELLQSPGAVALGGGTDLLVAIREGVASPRLVVDVRGIPGADALDWRPDGSLRIGAAARLARIAADPLVRQHLAALSMACESVGSVALRNMGTLGGNLCQRPRCAYFRTGVSCFKSGGSECPAEHGENQLHSILGGGPCHAVHPSDPAVALTALEAVVHVVGAGGTRRVPIADFFVPPRVDPTREAALEPGELVVAVEVPARSSGGRQRYLKVMQRGAWDFALASLAAVRRPDGAVRLVLGGVAPAPWRVTESVEEDVASGSLAAEDLDTLAERALHDARPLAKNGYKVVLAQSLLRDGMAFVAGVTPHD